MRSNSHAKRRLSPFSHPTHELVVAVVMTGTDEGDVNGAKYG
jgi:hypothetical protein